MSISKKQLDAAAANAYQAGKLAGIEQGKRTKEDELSHVRRASVVDLTKAAAELAQANAKLTYAMSQIAGKLL